MRKTILAIVAALLVAIGGAAAALYLYSRPTVLRVAVPQGAEDFRLMSAAAQVFARQREQVRLHVVPVVDAAASAAALDSEAADLAVIRADVTLPPTAQALVILHRNAALLVAPGGSKLKKVADLRGKRIGVLLESGGVERNMRLLETILAHSDVQLKSLSLMPVAPGEVKAAIQANRIDALFAVATPQSGPINDIVSAIASANGKSPVFVPISEAKAIAKRLPALEPMEVLQGAFGGDPPRPAASFDSSSVSAMLAARSALPDAVASDVTRLFFSNRAAIAVAAPLANAIEAPSTDKSAVIPAHQGAADYLSGEVRSFFERYTDFFYIGVMLLSVVGSGAAALASRFNTHAHQHTEQLAERLLEILQSARAATTLAELDDYERTVDDVLAHALSDRRLRSVEAPGLHVVSLALDQARRAIRERRRVLTKEGRVVNFRSQRAPGGG